MITITVDGRQHRMIGRSERIIRTLVERDADWSTRKKLKLTFNCADETVSIHAEEIIDANHRPITQLAGTTE